MTEKRHLSLYSDDLSLLATISEEGESLYIDFYKDEILFHSLNVTEQGLEQAFVIANDYVAGKISIDPNTWRVNVRTANIR